MKLTSVKNSIVDVINVPGLVSGKITYNIKDGIANVAWTGPKLSAPLWHAILAFFRDTYKETHSECQVRLYVNTQTNVWGAWAFPQEARSYMNAREVNTPEAKEQRAVFKDSEGWVYCGTVHHHCSATAFQSGTDRDNEKGQDGLHITVGKMDSAQHDMHARFYLSGAEFSPNMAMFWDIGDTARQCIPPELHDIVARHQMTIPAPENAVYPDQWKANLIEIKTVAVGFHNGAAVDYGNGNVIGAGGANGSGNDITWAPEHKRKEMALGECRNLMRARNQTNDDLDAAFALLSQTEVLKMVRSVAARFRLTVFDIVSEWEWEQDMKEQAERPGIDQSTFYST